MTDTAEGLRRAEIKSLRDEFAMAALTGYCANKIAYTQSAQKDRAEAAASDAYAVADAMMKERSRRK